MCASHQALCVRPPPGPEGLQACWPCCHSGTRRLLEGVQRSQQETRCVGVYVCGGGGEGGSKLCVVKERMQGGWLVVVAGAVAVDE